MNDKFYVYCKKAGVVVALHYKAGKRSCCYGDHIDLHTQDAEKAFDKVRQMGYPLY